MSKNVDINNIDIKKLNKIFEGIDFNHDSKVNTNNPIDLNSCYACGSDEIIEDIGQGVLVCTSCGQVLESNIFDSTPDGKGFDDTAVVGRCNKISNPLLPQSSLGTAITGYGKSRLKTLHSWNAMPYRERTLNNEFKKIQDVCFRGNIPKCVEDDIKIMYKLASDCKRGEKNKYVITRGLNRIGISSGCTFLACLKNGLTRTSREIAILYGIKEQEMNKGFKTLLKLLKIGNVNLNLGTSKAEHFVRRYCEELKIKNIHIDAVIQITRNIEKLNIVSDHTPYTVSAASILLMAELFELKSITRKKLSQEFGLTDVTIKKTYDAIANYRHVLLNNNAINEIAKEISIVIEQEDIPPEVLARMREFDIINDNDKIENLKSKFDIENARQILAQLKIRNKEIKKNLKNLM